jgi:cytidyltransferase-like protein
MDKASKALVSHKIKTVEELVAIIGSRPRSKSVIMCHGTFDIVHPGHIRHLLFAKTKADILIASVTADQHITKGVLRPYVPDTLRSLNLAALEMVDYVVIDHDSTPVKNLALIRPDFFAKGYEYTSNVIPVKTKEEIAVLESYGGEIIFTPGDIVYSSSNLIEVAPPTLVVDKLLTLLAAENITFMDLYAALEKMKGIDIHVVGDTIVDTYTDCAMIGGMTKTPTISVRKEGQRSFVGGAGVVAKHLRAAGANVTFSTVLGNDILRDFVLADLTEAGIVCLPIIDSTRPTTEKNAIVCDGYRLLKIDTVDNRSISERVLETLQSQLNDVKTQSVVFSDFRHGIFNRSTIGRLTGSIPADAFRVADSQVASRWGNILDFLDFDLITPNEREARFALGDQDSVIRPLAAALYEKSRCRTLIMKCGQRGTFTYRSKQDGDLRSFFHIESFVDQLVDPVGAGDALLAYATLGLIATKNNVIASILGSIAAGVECECDGNTPVSIEAITQKLAQLERLTHYS